MLASGQREQAMAPIVPVPPSERSCARVCRAFAASAGRAGGPSANLDAVPAGGVADMAKLGAVPT